MGIIKKSWLIIAAISFFYPTTVCFADFVQLRSNPKKTVILVTADKERSLLFRNPEDIQEQIEDKLAILVKPGTKCIEIETSTYTKDLFFKNVVAKVLLVSGPNKGASGWIIDDALNYEYKQDDDIFESGDTIVYLKNDRQIRGDIFDQAKNKNKGVSLVLFNGDNEIFIRSELTKRVTSAEK
jgi:hypothetical protein